MVVTGTCWVVLHICLWVLPVTLTATLVDFLLTCRRTCLPEPQFKPLEQAWEWAAATTDTLVGVGTPWGLVERQAGIHPSSSSSSTILRTNACSCR